MTSTATAVPPRPRGTNLNGTRKAAILCMALGAEASARILQQLTPAEVERVSREIAQTPGVPAEIVDVVLSEYRDVLKAAESIAEGGVEYARRLLDAALGPSRAAVILDRIQAQLSEPGLARLQNAAPEVLAGMLRGEHPQTAALVLAHLDPRLAADVLAGLASETSVDLLFRIATMEKVSPDVLQMVEAGLGGRNELTLSAEMSDAGGPAAVARVLNQLPGTLEKTMLEGMNGRSTEIAEQIRNLMFVFEDLRRLDGRSMQRLLRDIDGQELALALKAVSEDLKTHILKNMSERAAAALREQIELLGPVKVKDVETAHANIVRTARALQEAGEIVMAMSSDDEIIA